MRTIPWALATTLILSSSGCLEHEETLVVSADGSLSVRYEVHGDAEDLEGGAAEHPADGPWQVTRSTRAKRDGKLEHVLTASAELGSVDELPAHFGDPESALTRATRLEVTPSAEGRVYRFSRSYGAREWAPYAFAQERAFPKEVRALFERLDDYPAFSAAERQQLVRGLCELERVKIAHWVERSLSRMGQHADARARAALPVQAALDAELAASVDAAFLERMLSDPERIEATSRALEARLHARAAAAAARALELGPDGERKLLAGLAREQRIYEVSEDLGDEAFVVRLRLPGTVLQHNADAVEGETLVWRFSGKDLRDRDHRLLATSLARPQ